MAAQRKGLGRGLSALLGMNDMGDDVLSTPVAPGLNTEPQQEQPREEFVDVGLATEDVPGVADMDFAPAEPTEEEQPQEKIVAVNIAVSDIDPNYEQPRKNFDEAALNELAESIRQHGVIQPIVVVRMGMRFMIISGERRWRASKLANKTTIPAIIKDYTPQQISDRYCPNGKRC